jgi:outer membrane receptor for ferrienterochelin and colicin
MTSRRSWCAARARHNARRWNAKRRAATAVDSIAAEDVGKFPDQNVNEAISRIAGVALDRGDSGEGQGISVRGNGMETTRVDIDGMTVLNTNGALANGVNAGGGPRGGPA